jgi:hypothetical protein
VTGRRLDPFDEREIVDLWDLTRLLLRRWYFAVPMLLASVATVVLAAQTVSPDYKATGYMQLIPAPSTGKIPDPKAKPKPANPWLDLGYAALGNAAALSVTDQSGLDKLVREGFTDSVTVVLNERTPLFEIEAVGDSKEQATGTVRQIVELLQTDIAAKQKQYGALPEDTISTLVINDGSSPEQETGKIKRVIIVAAGIGLLTTTASTIALDYWLRRRSRRPAGDDEPDQENGTGSVPPSPGAFPAEPRHHDMPETAEKTRVLRPQHANGNVYSGERRQAEVKTRAPGGPMNGSRDSAGTAEPEPPIDATVVLPASYPPRRTRGKRQ